MRILETLASTYSFIFVSFDSCTIQFLEQEDEYLHVIRVVMVIHEAYTFKYFLELLSLVLFLAFFLATEEENKIFN